MGTLAVSSNIDTSSYRAFAARMRKISPALKKELTKQIRAAGNDVRDQARTNASWSKKIPGTIRVSSASAYSATVTAGNSAVPIAALYETREWRHPVFGNRSNWSYQPGAPRPFLVPALAEKKDEIVERVNEAVADALGQAGV